MKTFINILSKNKIFLIPWFLFVVVSVFFLILYEKAEIHIFINSFHNSFFDFFFKYWTYLGDGLFAVLIIIILLFIQYKQAIITTVSFLLTALTVQILKAIIENPRPKFFFQYFYEGNYNLYFVDGTDPGNLFSFPSGHSASAFTIFFLLALFTKKQYLKPVFFIIALLTAFSRVYLSWHFLEDIVVGSVIAVLFTLIIYRILNKTKRTWLDLSLLKSFKRKV